MSQPRYATVRLVDELGASGKVREIFDDIKRTKNVDIVPSFWRALATSPDQLDLVWRQLKSLMHPETAGRTSHLDAKTREIIALAVSATNGCRYCVNSHTAALRKQGVDAETLGEVLAIAGLFNPTVQACVVRYTFPYRAEQPHELLRRYLDLLEGEHPATTYGLARSVELMSWASLTLMWSCTVSYCVPAPSTYQGWLVGSASSRAPVTGVPLLPGVPAFTRRVA